MHVVVIGGGIVGLAVARAVRAGGHGVTVCEKESRWAAHQTGRNSGVIHSGLYYRPGGLKARLCVAGAASMAAYATERGLPVEIGGKLVVAVHAGELPALAELERRGAANGVPLRRLDGAAAREYEPAVRCVAALRVATTGVVDYAAVARALAAELAADGAELRLGTTVVGVRADAAGVRVQTSAGELRGDALVNCAGLHSDRIARLAGLAPPARIVPFRGEYFELTPATAARVRGLIYPVPDPAFPFLGVHLTRGIDGGVHAGPNAVLALRREGYRWRDISARDLGEVLGYRGFWQLARRHARTGATELARSLSRRAFAAALARLLPGITAADLVPAPAGVRAQAVGPDGALLDDFLVQAGPRQVHVLNAPSPAATSALEIARQIAARLPAVVPG
ncbi:MAG TPA: L-2-hydroxyglutarate oxidase [Pseudonocardiaceae bacterium]|nr:L-2-hydroxyglutarate oxidase [Pseudonocardiaceae bacterium]